MSTNVKRNEWAGLAQVPEIMWSFWNPRDDRWIHNTLGPCDVNPEHGQALNFLQTSDHRAIALCMKCDAERISEAA